MDFSFLDDWTEEEEGAATIEEVGEGYRNIWVVAQAADGAIQPDSLAAVGQARELADQIVASSSAGRGVAAAQGALRQTGSTFGLRLDREQPEARVIEGWNAHLQRFV